MMKKSIVLCILNLLLFWFVCVYYHHWQNTMLRSTVKAPVRLFLMEIKCDLDNADYANASDKMNFLIQKWELFYLSDGLDAGIGNILPEWNETQGSSTK